MKRSFVAVLFLLFAIAGATSSNTCSFVLSYSYGWFLKFNLQSAETKIDQRFPQYPYWNQGNYFESDTADFESKKIYALLVKRPVDKALNASIFKIDLARGSYTISPSTPGRHFVDEVPGRIFFHNGELLAAGRNEDAGTIYFANVDLETGTLKNKQSYPFETKANWTAYTTYSLDTNNQVLLGIHGLLAPTHTNKLIAVDVNSKKVILEMDLPPNTSIPVLHYSPSRKAFFGIMGPSTVKSKLWTPISITLDVAAKSLDIKKGKDVTLYYEASLDWKNTAFDDLTGTLAQFYGYFNGYPYTGLFCVDIDTFELAIDKSYSQYPGYIFSGQSMYVN